MSWCGGVDVGGHVILVQLATEVPNKVGHDVHTQESELLRDALDHMTQLTRHVVIGLD